MNYMKLYRCADCLTVYALDVDVVVDGSDGSTPAKCQRVEANPNGVTGVCGGKYEAVR